MADARQTLSDLVARTEGPQPWRKVVHALNATAIAALIGLVDWPRTPLLWTLSAVVAGLFLGDLARLRSERLNALFFRSFSLLASPREAEGIASSTWYAAGILAAVALFPKPEAVAGILVLGLADPAAAVVGRAVGRRPFLGGTLEGSTAFFATAVIILSWEFGWLAAVPAAFAAALAERRSWPLDDNLAVPVVAAGMLVAAQWLLGPS